MSKEYAMCYYDPERAKWVPMEVRTEPAILQQLAAALAACKQNSGDGNEDN